MPQSRTESPPPWPAEVTQPAVPDWEKSAIRWLWELLPAHYRERWILVTYPRLLAYQAYRQVEGEIYILRRQRVTYADMEALGLPPGAIEHAIRLDASALHQLTRVRREILVVSHALARLRPAHAHPREDNQGNPDGRTHEPPSTP